MRIQHNIMAMSAYRNYTNNVSAMKKNLEKLSSGYKINRAGDDAAGLAISEKMRAQITGLETAQKNAKDGISLVQTAEGALTEVHDMLNRMVELATQSANGTYDNTTDRAQMQKEVDQLLKEINRIADSSNFNGINLLDGTLGLNKDAFSFSEAAAVSASDGTINLTVSAADAGAKITHLEEAGNAKEVDPSFTVDLSKLEIDTSKANDTITFKFAGITQTVALTTTSGTAGVSDGDALATALATALKAGSASYKKDDGTVGGAAGNAVKIGDFVFDVAANGSELNFTFAGMAKTGGLTANGAADTDKTFTAEQAKAINDAIGTGVEWSAGADTTKIKDIGVAHNTTKVNYAQAITDSSLAGIDVTIDANLIKNNTKITIDGVEFTVYSDPSDTATHNGATDLDIRAGKTDEERIHMLVDALSNKTVTATGDGAGRTWKIEAKNGNTIHLDQTAATTNSANALNSYDKLKGVISAKGEATTAKNVGTNIKITDAEVKEGNTLTIDGKKYVFSDEKTGTDGDTTYVAIKGGAGQNLANAITGSGSEYDAATNTVTVRAANATDKAPMVLGKGLTLQIGDTSDTFNQLNVAVQDMHAASLGIKDLKINTEEAAQAAIKNIKDAINTVSDVRGTLGATQNRLDHTINNLSVMTENIQDAESTIRDVDVAEEMMAYTKNNILIQSAQAMLAQANQVPQGVLQLLQ